MTLLPTTRLAYWTGIFRCPWTTMMMPMVTAKKRSDHDDRQRQARARRSVPIGPEEELVGLRRRRRGWSARMPIVISSETPLPMPRWVICSPSHISSIVPAVR